MISIKTYCLAIPDFALYLKFAKQETLLYNIIEKNNKEDLYQIIAESILAKKTVHERNGYLKAQMYYFASRILNYRKIPKIENNTEIGKYYYKAKKENICDLCGKTSNHYHYKSFIPNKKVCRLCYNKLRRQDLSRNK